jgi:hypothetical protein
MAQVRGPSVRDVYLFGYETFPNARRDWPRAEIFPPSFDQLHDMIYWCDQQFGRANWYRNHNVFYFNDEEDALLFKMRYK